MLLEGGILPVNCGLLCDIVPILDLVFLGLPKVVEVSLQTLAGWLDLAEAQEHRFLIVLFVLLVFCRLHLNLSIKSMKGYQEAPTRLNDQSNNSHIDESSDQAVSSRLSSHFEMRFALLIEGQKGLVLEFIFWRNNC